MGIHDWRTAISNEPVNPFEVTSSRNLDALPESRFLLGLKKALLAAIFTASACVVLVFVAKGIDWLIPGEGALHESTIISVLWRAAFLFLLVTMISFFTTFAYIAGGRQLDPGVCVLAIFFSGILGTWVLSLYGFQSPRRLRMEHPPIYLFEFLMYFIPYAIAAAILTALGSLRLKHNSESNQAPM